MVLPHAAPRGFHCRHLARSLQDHLPWYYVRSQLRPPLLDATNPASTALLGVAILFITSIPTFLERGAGFPGLLVGLIVIGLG
jgi:hypothetical protein